MPVRVIVEFHGLVAARVEAIPDAPCIAVVQLLLWDDVAGEDERKPSRLKRVTRKPPRPRPKRRVGGEVSYPLLEFRWKVAPSKPTGRGKAERDRLWKVFVNRIERRLEAAEEHVHFSLEDWDRLCAVILPERYLAPPAPKEATSAVPGFASKVEAMRRRVASGESLYHPGDPSDLPARLAIAGRAAGNHAKRAATKRNSAGDVELVEADVISVGWEADRSRAAARKAGTLSLVGCMDADDDEYVNAAVSKEPGAVESGCRRAREAQ